MKKEKREKTIKKLFDEEFGPNLSVDEICSEIDFTHQNGIKVVKEEVKPFYKKPIFMKLTYICLLLVCVLSTFVVTKNVDNSYCENFKTSNILDYEEIKFLENGGYKYNENLIQTLIIKDEVIVYSFIVNNNDKKTYWLKMHYLKNDENSLKIICDEKIFNCNEINDLQNIGNLDENNEINFNIEYKGIINQYSIQCN